MHVNSTKVLGESAAEGCNFHTTACYL